jgi:stage V sporulation protein D (sporulation-specific penicillin-binding protein)
MVTSQQQRSEQGVIRKRMEVVFLCFLAALGIQVARLGYLQWIKARDFAEVANRVQMKTFTVQSRRGKISDRNSNPLAQDQVTQTIVINPQVVTDATATTRRIGSMLGLSATDVEAMRARLERARSGERKSYYCQLLRNVDRRRAKQVMDKGKSEATLAGIWLEDSPSRLNPSGVDAAQIIGGVNIDGVGTEGIELKFEKTLHGQDGERRVRVSATGQPIPESETRMVEPVDGKDVRLTLDRNVQHFVEAELDKVAAQERPDAATALVMDIRSGELLAMANWPRPTRSLKSASTAERRNRAITDLFEPGSVFKVLTAAAALEYGVPTHTHCSGSVMIGRHRVGCAHGAVHGSVSLRKMIEQSCNLGAATLARRVGPERFHNFLQRLGLDEKTGIEFPGEESGRMQNPEKWSAISTANIGFGQGIAVTPLQLLAAYSAIANDGLYIPPKLILSAPEGAVQERPARQVMKPENAKLVREAMEAVVSTGTGTKAKIPAYSVGGKTGTAQIATRGGYMRGGYVASFAGFVPLDKPRLAILVSVWHPRVQHYGGSVAAPVFREIARQAVSNLGIQPDAPSDTRDGANPGSMRRSARGGGPRD